jgi:hypothetical protein
MTMNLLSMKEKSFLKQLAFLKSLSQDDGEEEVCNLLDFLQSSDEEKKALDDFVTYSMRMEGWFGEWEPGGWDVPCGDGPDRFNWGYTNLLDEAEMARDMEIFEEFEACHELFASAPFDDRKPGKTGIFNPVTKRSELSVWGKLVAIGDSYGTLKTHLGKAFLPKYLLDPEMNIGDPCRVRVQFKGFSPAPGVSMPWRVLQVEEEEYTDSLKGMSDEDIYTVFVHQSEVINPQISFVNCCIEGQDARIPATTYYYNNPENDSRDTRASRMADDFLTQMDDVTMWPTLA